MTMNVTGEESIQHQARIAALPLVARDWHRKAWTFEASAPTSISTQLTVPGGRPAGREARGDSVSDMRGY